MGCGRRPAFNRLGGLTVGGAPPSAFTTSGLDGFMSTPAPGLDARLHRLRRWQQRIRLLRRALRMIRHALDRVPVPARARYAAAITRLEQRYSMSPLDTVPRDDRQFVLDAVFGAPDLFEIEIVVLEALADDLAQHQVASGLGLRAMAAMLQLERWAWP
jgi:hypothetical protein